MFNNIASINDIPDGYVTYSRHFDTDFCPYDIAPVIRPIVFVGPVLASSRISSGMRGLLVKYLQASFEDHIEVSQMEVTEAVSKKLSRQNSKSVLDAVTGLNSESEGSPWIFSVSDELTEIFQEAQINRIYRRSQQFKVTCPFRPVDIT